MAYYTVQRIRQDQSSGLGESGNLVDDPLDEEAFVHDKDEVMDRMIREGEPGQTVNVFKYGNEYVDGWEVG